MEHEPMQFKFNDISNLISKYKKFIFIFTLTITSIALVLTFILPYQYTAITTILPSEDSKSNPMSSMLGDIAGGITLGGISKKDATFLYIDILKSRNLLFKVAKELKLENYPQFRFDHKSLLLDRLSDIITVNNYKSGMLVIAVTVPTVYFPNDSDVSIAKKLSSEIANCAAKNLNIIYQQNTSSSAKRKRVFIEKVLNDNISNLDSLDKALELFRNQNKVLELEEQSKAILNNTINIGSELFKAEIELNLANQDYKPSSPLVQGYINKVSELKKQYNRAQSGNLSSEDDFSISLNNVPKLIRMYTNLLRDQKIQESLREFLETEKYQSLIQEQSDIPTVQILDEAEPPYQRDSPNRLITLIASLILSFLIAIGLVFARTYLLKKL